MNPTTDFKITVNKILSMPSKNDLTLQRQFRINKSESEHETASNRTEEEGKRRKAKTKQRGERDKQWKESAVRDNWSGKNIFLSDRKSRLTSGSLLHFPFLVTN